MNRERKAQTPTKKQEDTLDLDKYGVTIFRKNNNTIMENLKLAKALLENHLLYFRCSPQNHPKPVFTFKYFCLQLAEYLGNIIMVANRLWSEEIESKKQDRGTKPNSKEAKK